MGTAHLWQRKRACGSTISRPSSFSSRTRADRSRNSNPAWNAPRTARGSGPPHKYTPHDFVAEDRLDRKRLTHLTEFYDEVIARLRGAEAILILGPGEAKSEFLKRIHSKKLGGGVEVKTADKMTDREIAAKVSEHFATSAAA